MSTFYSTFIFSWAHGKAEAAHGSGPALRRRAPAFRSEVPGTTRQDSTSKTPLVINLVHNTYIQPAEYCHYNKQ